MHPFHSVLIRTVPITRQHPRIPGMLHSAFITPRVLEGYIAIGVKPAAEFFPHKHSALITTLRKGSIITTLSG